MRLGKPAKRNRNNGIGHLQLLPFGFAAAQIVKDEWRSCI